jgi:hypothetical protein
MTQGYLAHKKPHPPQGPQQAPRHGLLGSWGGACWSGAEAWVSLLNEGKKKRSVSFSLPLCLSRTPRAPLRDNVSPRTSMVYYGRNTPRYLADEKTQPTSWDHHTGLILVEGRTVQGHTLDTPMRTLFI